MELCSNGHDEVCFDNRYCPVCNITEDLEGSIDDLEIKISDLEVEIKTLEEQNNG